MASNGSSKMGACMEGQAKGAREFGKIFKGTNFRDTKNWPFLSAFLLAILVFLLGAFHEIEGNTPLATTLACVISVFGLVWAAINMQISVSLQESIEKLTKSNQEYERANEVYRQNNKQLEGGLEKFEGLNNTLRDIAKEQGQDLQDMLQRTSGAIQSLRGIVSSQKRQLAIDEFVNVQMRYDTESGLSKDEFERMQPALPEWCREVCKQYTFETFPRKGGGGGPIMLTDFAGWLDSLAEA